MAKDKKIYVCEYCGEESLTWMGRCPSCGQWNTLKEMRVAARNSSTPFSAAKATFSSAPTPIREISADKEVRMDMCDPELNRVLGGGLVQGSLVLLGGEPGIGKSTLVLQTILGLAGRKVLYVSGEESARQIKLRAERINPDGSDDVMVYTSTSLESIFEQISSVAPDLVVIDSIQTISTESVESSPGSLSQIRECAAQLLKYAKGGTGVSIILIGHITKDGNLAGPKVLEHIVDTVLQFEGDQHYLYRILRSIKNRFGSTAEIGIYEMRQEGLRIVSNPSELLLSENRDGLSGVAISSAIEGVRPFMIEVQALVSTAAYGTAQRSTIGFEGKRLNMLLAVLEKRVGFKLAQKDVFLNIAGGLRVSDPALDLAVVAAVLSSNVDQPIETDVAMCGEIGLSGEIRPVSRIEQRIGEAQRLGFSRIVLPKGNMSSIDPAKYTIQLCPVARLADAVRELFG